MTENQKRLLDFITGEIARRGISPSYEEMATHLGLRSKSGVHRLVQALLDRGYLAREGYARGLIVPRGDADWERMRSLLAAKRPTMQTMAELRAVFRRMDQLFRRRAA